MDSSSSRITRNLLIVFAGATAVLVTWFVLGFLFEIARWTALPLLLLTCIFMIVLVLIQRGKGGGLAGALGGMGGQSAFGTKAGDLFTRITIGVALFWIVLCMVTVGVLGTPQSILREGMGGGSPVREGMGPPAEEDPGPGPDDTPSGGGPEDPPEDSK